jgi:hypothetical protein
MKIIIALELPTPIGSVTDYDRYSDIVYALQNSMRKQGVLNNKLEAGAFLPLYISNKRIGGISSIRQPEPKADEQLGSYVEPDGLNRSGS